MTTKDVIKLLQIDEKVKLQLLTLYDHMPPEQKLEVQRAVWSAYFALFNQQLDKQLDTQFKEVIDGKEHFGEDYYPHAVKKAEQALEKEKDNAATKTDLSVARRAMEQIVGEINAAKSSKKGKSIVADK